MELRCFLLSDDKDGDHRLWKPPMHAHGKTRYPHLVKWEEASILYSLGYLEIVYERSSPAAGEPRYAVVPSQYVRLDDWPEAPRSGQDHADGFSDQTRLRIVLRPMALRLVWSRVLTKMAEGWPSAADTLRHGLRLSNRDAVHASFDPLCPVGAPSPPAYCAPLRTKLLGWPPLAPTAGGGGGGGGAGGTGPSAGGGGGGGATGGVGGQVQINDKSGNLRDGCFVGDALPQQGPCVLRYSDFSSAANAAAVRGTYTKFIVKYWFTQKGAMSMEMAKKLIDTASSDFDDNRANQRQPALLETVSNAQVKTKKAKWLASTLVKHCGTTVAGWLSCVNVAWLQYTTGGKGGAKRRAAFAPAKTKQLSQQEKLEVTRACAEAVGASSLSRALYNYWRGAFDSVPTGKCPPWDTMMGELRSMLGTWFDATTDSRGALGTVAGAVTDPNWWAADLLKVRWLVEGVPGKEVGGAADEHYGLVLERRPAQVYVVFEDAALAQRLSSDTRPSRAVLLHLSTQIFGGDELLAKHPGGRVPLARLGWLRGQKRHGAHAVEHLTAIIELSDADHMSRVRAFDAARSGAGATDKLPGVRLAFDMLVNNDAFHNIDGFVVHNIVASGTKTANMGTQAQLCVHVRELRHSTQFCFPYMFLEGDDDYEPYEAHARTPLPNAPEKYPTMHAAKRDLCNSPFELADGRLVTFCGPHISDYKCTCNLCGMDITPRSDRNDVCSMATNAERGKPAGDLVLLGMR